MNWESIDDAPEELLNEIIWRSVKGADSEMPRPHTSRDWSALDREEDERSIAH
jgi:hypothetical protein